MHINYIAYHILYITILVAYVLSIFCKHIYIFCHDCILLFPFFAHTATLLYRKIILLMKWRIICQKTLKQPLHLSGNIPVLTGFAMQNSVSGVTGVRKVSRWIPTGMPEICIFRGHRSMSIICVIMVIHPNSGMLTSANPGKRRTFTRKN